MREILFRGKRTDTGEWVQGGYVGDVFFHLIFEMHTDESPLGNLYPCPDEFEVRPETVGQFTGLTDKNGRKIFEGDIIQWKNNRFYVEHGEGVTGFIARKKGAATWVPCMNRGTMDTYEIVGNIHDNPELMEG